MAVEATMMNMQMQMVPMEQQLAGAQSGSAVGGPRPPGGLVALPEDIQQLAVGDTLGVKIHLHGFRVVTDVAVVRIVRPSPSVAYTCANHTFDHPELGFDSPESPQSEGCGLEDHRCGCIDDRRCRGFGR